MIRETAGKYPQDSYAMVVFATQSEWIFLQRVTTNMGNFFVGVENIIQETSLLRLFFRKKKSFSPIVGDLSMILVKTSGLRLLNKLTSANEKYLSSQQESVEIIRVVTGRGAFYNAYHLLVLREEKLDGKKNQDGANDTKVKFLVGDLIGNYQHLIL